MVSSYLAAQNARRISCPHNMSTFVTMHRPLKCRRKRKGTFRSHAQCLIDNSIFAFKTQRFAFFPDYKFKFVMSGNKDRDRLMVAIQKGNADKVARILDASPDLDASMDADSARNSLLHRAARYGYVKVHMMDKKFNFNLKLMALRDTGGTNLLLHAHFFNFSLAKAKDQNERTAANHACNHLLPATITLS